METIDFVKKLELILAYYQLSASAFADKIGFQRSSMSHLLSGRNKPSLDFVVKISSAFKEIDINWFLFDKGTFPRSIDSSSEDVNQNLLKENETLTAQNQKVKSELQQLLSKYNELSAKTSLFSNEEQSLKSENQSLKIQLDEMQLKLSQIELTSTDQTNQSDYLEQIETLNAEINQLKADNFDIELKNKFLSQEKIDLNLKIEKFARLENQQVELINLNKKFQSEIESLKADNKTLIEKLGNNENSRTKLIALELELSSLKEQNQLLIDKNIEMTNEITLFETRFNEQNLIIEDFKQQLEDKSTENQKSSNTPSTDMPPSDIEQVMVLYKNGAFKAYKN